MVRTNFLTLKADEATTELINADITELKLVVEKLFNHASKFGGLRFGTSLLSWVASFAAMYLLILDRTNWRSNMLTSLLVPYIFFSLPPSLFHFLRGQFGMWVAFIAVVLRLFFPRHFPDSEWEQLDSTVKLWLFGSISQNLITSAYSTKATTRKVWLNLHSLFYENKESTAMQLESELRSISLGDLSIRAYSDKIKKPADLLEGLGEKIKDRNVVIHALNGLPSKFDSIANIIRYTKPFPSLSEMRSMLSVEETRLNNNRVSTPSHDHHTSALSLLHAGTTSSNRGSGGGSYRGSNSRRGGSNHNHNRRRQHYNTTGQPSASTQYGWVYIPPPSHTQPPLWVSPAPPQQQWVAPPFPYPTAPLHTGQQQHHQSWARNNHGSQGVLGSRPTSTHQQHQYSLQAHHQTSEQPPWAWLGSVDQPTSLPNAFNTMTLNDPGTGSWVMDTGATDHVHANEDSTSSNPL